MDSATSSAGRRWTAPLPSIRGLAAGLFAVLAIVLGASSALAANQNVSITDPSATGCSTGSGGQGTSYCYIPNSVTVSSGDTVTWTNNSTPNHTVTRCGTNGTSGVASGCPAIGAAGNDGSSGDTFSSASLAPSGSGTYSHTFSGAGSYTYYCTIHGYSAMRGTVTVQAAAAPSPAATSPATSAPALSASPGPALPHSGAPPWASAAALAPEAALGAFLALALGLGLSAVVRRSR